MTITIYDDCQCCGGGVCEVCEVQPTGLRIDIDGLSAGSEDCGGCGAQFHAAFILEPVPGEPCAFQLLFEDLQGGPQEITCYDNGGGAGFYGEIKSDLTWSIVVLASGGETIARWEQDTPSDDCISNVSPTPMGKPWKEALLTFQSTTFGANTFASSTIANVSLTPDTVICDWTDAEVYVRPLSP